MNTLIIVRSIIFAVCCIGVRGDSSTVGIQLGTVNAPMVASVDLNSFSGQIQTYVDHVLKHRVAAILAEKTTQAVNEAVAGIVANVTSNVIKTVKGIYKVVGFFFRISPPFYITFEHTYIRHRDDYDSTVVTTTLVTQINVKIDI